MKCRVGVNLTEHERVIVEALAVADDGNLSKAVRRLMALGISSTEIDALK